MEKINPDKATVFDQKQANQIAQLLNIVFNNATLYGGKHPSTQKSAVNFASSMQKIFNIIPMITLVCIGKSLYIDKWCVDQKMNTNRLISAFQRFGIESISFENGVAADDVKTFIEIFSNPQSFPTVEKMNDVLIKQGVSKISLNYVFYQKVTKDETVINKDALGSEKRQHAPKQDINKERTFDQIDRLISLKDLLENPEHVAGNILEAAGADIEGESPVVGYLKEINRQIRNGKNIESNFSVDEMMESVFKLTTELRHGLAVQKEIGKIIKEEALVIDEVDQLTYQAIIQVVREEYKCGKITVKRLSHIIRRILPDVKDLKRLLPQLKEALIADGMSLTDFLELTKELNKELQNEGLIRTLEEGAANIGLSVDEIVQAINVNPKEAVRLIVLASEIKLGTGGDQSRLSNLLSDYIEGASSKIALQSKEAADYKGWRVLENIIHQIENRLINKLKTQDVSNSIITEVEEQLANRFPKTLNKLKASWIVNIISNGKELSSSNLVQLLNTVVDKKKDLELIKAPIEEALVAHGFNRAQIEDIFTEIFSRIAKKKQSIPLPKHVLNSKNIKFFLQRQIKANYRYGNPFSCVNISVTAVFRAGSWQSVSTDVVSQVMPDVCMVLKGFLRDLDLIGSLGKLDKNSLFIILPMTEEHGASVVKEKLDTILSQSKFLFKDESVKLNIVISVIPFNKEETQDCKSCIELIKKHHKIEEERNNRL